MKNFIFNIILISGLSHAATYYVAPSGNDSTGNGTISSPWQTITKGQSMLAPGDTLLVRGGRYRESITLTKQGTAGNPVTIKAYPNETPILDGTEPVTGWTQCTSAETFLTVQGTINPNYANIYKAKILASKLPSDLAKFMLFESGEHGRIARWPDQLVGYGIDMTLFNSVAPEAYNQTTFLKDSTRLNQADNYWTGAWIDIFSHAANAWVIRRNIASSSQSAHTITFDTPLANPISYGSTPDSYSIVNHPHVLDSPGEFAHTASPDNQGYYTFYLWPHSSANLSNNITIPSKANAIYASGKSYITIDGLKATGYTNNVLWLTGSSSRISNIIIKNCTVEDSGGSGIYLVDTNYSMIDQCVVNRVEGRGAFINTGSYGVIKNCVIKDTASTNASFYAMTYGQMIGNTLYGCIGSHGNGSSCYLGCDKILIAYNYYPKSNLALQDIKNVVIYANVLDSEETTTSILDTWADSSGRTQEYQIYLNNTILGGSNNSSLGLKGQTASPYPQNYVVNNIIDGCNSWDASQVIDMSYNLYTGYGWRQESRYGWTLKTGEIDGRSIALSTIFNNPGMENGGDYTLKANSPVIAKGKSIAALLNTIGVTAWFPDFDFTKDKAGNTWAATPSIGAYEYNTSQPANRAPVAGNDTSTVTQNSIANALAVLANDSDPDGDPLAIVSITAPTHGTAVISGTQINYTPTAAYIGSDSFTYTISDGKGGTSSATISITILQATQDDITAGLVGKWEFDENNGTTSLDLSGNLNTATLINQTQWNENSIQLNGVNNYADCGTRTSLNLTGSLTLSAWVLPNSYGQAGYGRIIDKGSSSAGFSLFLNQNNNNLGYAVYGGAIAYSNAQVIQLNTWQHVAVVYDQTAQQIRFYVNGVLSGQTSYSINPVDSSANPLVIGIRHYDMNRAFNGQIDSVRIYNRALSDTETAEVYALGHTVTVPAAYTLSLIATNGSVTLTPNKTTYSSGEVVTLTAVPNTGYSFNNWSGDATGTTNPVTITMNGNKSVTASFTPASYTLTTTAAAGSITKKVGGAVTTATSFTAGTVVELTATPNTGYAFGSWSGGATGTTNPVTITMDANKSVTANFTAIAYTLTTAATNGTVTKSPSKATYTYGETVTLTAAANTGYTFGSWSGSATGTTNPVTITMNSNKAVTANFTAAAYTLTTTATNGTITASPVKATYTYGETVTLTAAANAGYTFGSWSGDATGTAASVTVTINGNKSVTANFTAAAYTLTTTATNGTITASPVKATYAYGDTVTLTATPSAGYTFSSWSGSTTGTTNPVTITMNANKSVTANFNAATYTLTTTATNGTITASPVKATYTYGETVTLTAAANAGYTFGSWSGSATGTTNPVTITMNSNKAVTANFNAAAYTLTTTATNGTITASPVKATYAYGDTVTLTAAASAGYTFGSWSGSATGTTNPVSITMNSNKAVTANFTAAAYTLTTTATNGTITASPVKATYAYGDTVTLTATANAGYTFGSWSGGATGTTNPVTITMNANKSVTASFSQLTLSDGLTGHWLLDETTGVAAIDCTAAKLTANVVGGASWGYAWANEDLLDLNSTTQALAIPASTVTAQAGTIAVWMAPKDLAGTKFILGHVYNASNRISLYTVAGKLAVGLGSNAALLTDIAALTIEQPVHIALSWNGTAYAVYVDGQSKASGSFSGITALNSTIDIGNYGDPASRTLGFMGDIDDVRTYNRALAGSEIATLYTTYDVKQRKPLTFTISAVNDQGVPIVYNAASLPAGAQFDVATQTLTWLPWYDQAGNYNLRFTAAGQPDRIISVSVQTVTLSDWYRSFLIQQGKLAQ